MTRPYGWMLVLAVATTACKSARVAPLPTAASVAPSVDTIALSEDLVSVLGDTGAPEPGFSGTWIGGTGPEPPQRVITLELQCRYHPAAWVLDQRGDTVESYHFPESWDQGVARREPPMVARGIVGRIRRGALYLTEGKDQFVLRYDPASGHLRGTVNGQSFWAAQRVVARQRECPAVP